MPARLLPTLALLGASVLVGCGDGTDASATCQYREDGSVPAADVEPPPGEPTASGDVAVTIATSAGAVDATLDAEAAPCTVNSFLSLAEQGFFDHSPCHRLTTASAGIHVLQCGDPTGIGSGSPGYRFADELTGDETYPAGTLAMANGGPDSNGSQFFMVYDDTPLGPDYTVFGTLEQGGLEVVRDVAAQGTANGAPDGPPATEVTIESVTVD